MNRTIDDDDSIVHTSCETPECGRLVMSLRGAAPAPYCPQCTRQRLDRWNKEHPE